MSRRPSREEVFGVPALKKKSRMKGREYSASPDVKNRKYKWDESAERPDKVLDQSLGVLGYAFIDQQDWSDLTVEQRKNRKEDLFQFVADSIAEHYPDRADDIPKLWQKWDEIFKGIEYEDDPNKVTIVDFIPDEYRHVFDEDDGDSEEEADDASEIVNQNSDKKNEEEDSEDEEIEDGDTDESGDDDSDKELDTQDQNEPDEDKDQNRVENAGQEEADKDEVIEDLWTEASQNASFDERIDYTLFSEYIDILKTTEGDEGERSSRLKEFFQEGIASLRPALQDYIKSYNLPGVEFMPGTNSAKDSAAPDVDDSGSEGENRKEVPLLEKQHQLFLQALNSRPSEEAKRHYTKDHVKNDLDEVQYAIENQLPGYEMFDEFLDENGEFIDPDQDDATTEEMPIDWNREADIPDPDDTKPLYESHPNYALHSSFDDFKQAYPELAAILEDREKKRAYNDIQNDPVYTKEANRVESTLEGMDSYQTLPLELKNEQVETYMVAAMRHIRKTYPEKVRKYAQRYVDGTDKSEPYKWAAIAEFGPDIVQVEDIDGEPISDPDFDTQVNQNLADIQAQWDRARRDTAAARVDKGDDSRGRAIDAAKKVAGGAGIAGGAEALRRSGNSPDSRSTGENNEVSRGRPMTNGEAFTAAMSDIFAFGKWGTGGVLRQGWNITKGITLAPFRATGWAFRKATGETGKKIFGGIGLGILAVPVGIKIFAQEFWKSWKETREKQQDASKKKQVKKKSGDGFTKRVWKATKDEIKWLLDF